MSSLPRLERGIEVALRDVPEAAPMNADETNGLGCEHATVIDQEPAGGTLIGWCADCGEPVAATGPEDETGVPSWETTP